MVRMKQAGEKTDWGLPREWAQNRVRRARPHREGTGSGPISALEPHPEVHVLASL